MQMRAGRPAGHVDEADDVTLADLAALAEAWREAAHVCIHGRDVAFMLEDDHIAVAILHAGKLHQAVAHRSRGCAGGGRKVGAQVRTPLLQNRVKAHRKTAADARELHR